MTKHVPVFTVLAFVLTVSAAAAQPTIQLSATAVAPGQPVTVAITGTPGLNFALIGSSVNSGFSYAGVPLAVGSDVTILAIGVLDGSGNATVTFTPPFNGTTLDRYYIQAVQSTSPSFVPLQAGASAVIRNADLVSGTFGAAFRGQPTVNVPAGSYVVHSIVQVVNGSGTEFATSCHLTGGFTGVSYPAAIYVPAGRTDTVPLLAAITAAAPTTISVVCGTAPSPSVGFSPAIVAVQVGTITP